jgi:hypothetical protein
MAVSVIKNLGKKGIKAIKGAFKKKKKVTKAQYKARGSSKPGRKSKYGTKGSTKGWTAFDAAQTGKTGAKTGKTTGKGKGKTTGKGKSTAWYDKKWNPFGKGISAKNTVTAIPRGVVGAAKFAYKKPVDAIAYTVAGNWAGKKLGLWGNKGKQNKIEVPKPKKHNYIPKINTQSIERTGGPVRAHGGRVTPGMKTGGSLKWINGKWVR